MSRRNFPGPAEVVRRMFAAFAEGPAADAAELVHPAAVERFKSEMVQLVEEGGEDGAGAPSWFLDVFGTDSAEELRDRDGAALLAAFLAARRERRPESERIEDPKVVAYIFEAEDEAYVVYRRFWMHESELHDRLEVLTMVRTPDGWRSDGIGHLRRVVF